MRIVLAPDKFKGSLSAPDAADAMRRGALRAAPDAHVDACPLADGGEGTLDVVARALGAEVRECRVTNAIGEVKHARWAMTPGGRAVIEVAEAVGLSGVPKNARDPTATSSFGVGELLLEAIAKGARTAIVAVGGTATMDGGAGMAEALGAKFDGVTRPIVARSLRDVRAIDRTEVRGRLRGLEITGACDVDNPLTGPSGAAATFAPQKGATAEQVESLEAALLHLRVLTGEAEDRPGDGAGGGLGFGLRVFAGARLVSGADLAFECAGVDSLLDGADLVLTGEGRLDAQSLRGKVVGALVRRTRARNLTTVALAGSIGAGAERLLDAGLSAFFSICDRPLSEDAAERDAAELLERATEHAVRLWSAARNRA